MSDLKRDLRRYIDGLEEPVSVQETMALRSTRRYGVPAAILAGAAVVLIPALVLVGLRLLPPGDGDIAETTVPPTTVTTTTVAETATTSVDTTIPPVPIVEVPNLDGLTVAEATAILDGLGLELEVTEQYPSRSGFGLITAQGPIAGETADVGSTVVVGVRVEAACLTSATEPEIPAGSMAVQVLFECAGDGFYPDISSPVYRTVPETPNVIEATLRALLAGLSPQEQASGLVSFFSVESADALESVTLEGDRLIVDFDDAILINNASTSAGSMYFGAELSANLYQFPAVNSIEYRLNGSCDAFHEWLQGSCRISTRAEWEQSLAAWEAERALRPEPGQEVRVDDIVGRMFTTQTGDAGQEILHLDGGTQTYSGFNEIGGWLVDDPDSDPAEWTNWALHVTGLNEEMIWLVDSGERTEDGRMVFEVRATLAIPWDEIALTADPFVVNGADACTLDGDLDPTVVAVTEIADNSDGSIAEIMRTLRAWRIDVENATFEEIPTDGIECLFPYA